MDHCQEVSQRRALTVIGQEATSVEASAHLNPRQGSAVNHVVKLKNKYRTDQQSEHFNMFQHGKNDQTQQQL